MMERYDMSFYVQALDKYIVTGECDKYNEEPLYGYLLSVMNDASVKFLVLSNEICARVFYDMMVQFIRLNMEKERFNMQRSMSERMGMKNAMEWSLQKKKDGWQALVQSISEKYEPYGFDYNFYLHEFGDLQKYADENFWEKMGQDWEDCFQKKMNEERSQQLELRKKSETRTLMYYLNEIPQYLKNNHIDKDEFYQAWGMMGGIWNATEFDRVRRIIALQTEFPEIVKVVNRMGRIADDDGKDKIYASEGDVYKMDHSTKSDILGVSTGNDISAMMPLELANCADDKLEELFFYRYLTSKLQIFRYKSEIMKPSRNLDSKKASRRGPMIICLDTSGSMAGKPEKIAESLLIKAFDVSDRQHRDCFLIAFSVSVHPVDVKRDRAKLLSMLSNVASGDTSATRMMVATFDLLESNPKYINADVLWITDFKIPLPSAQLMKKMAEYRAANTCFYGLQIGMAENYWLPFFDFVYKVGYTPSRRY
jgi:uncharacterized protein with von Willebrand factor type A (vWA) domain